VNWLARGLFIPTQNRHYTGKKLHAKMYFLVYTLPTLVILLVLLALNPSTSPLYLLVGFVALTLIDYFVFDRIADRLLWNLVFKRFYDHKPGLTPVEHHIIKNLEKNPTFENAKIVNKHVK
jgi:hypothetical protein